MQLMGRIAPILVRSKDDAIAFGGNRNRGNGPAIQPVRGVGQRPARQIDRRVAGVEELNPIRIVAITVLERPFIVGHELTDAYGRGRRQRAVAGN